MRNFALCSVVSLGLFFSAAHADQQKVHFDGTQLSSRFSLKSDQVHTIYEDREVQDTCYRTEQDGYETECQTDYREECSDSILALTLGGEDPPGGVRRGGSGPGRARDGSVSRGGGGPSETRGGGSSGGGSDDDHSGGGSSERTCSQVPYQRCWAEPRYVSVPYSCTKVISVPVGTALDYHVQANALVNFHLGSQGIVPNEDFNLTLDGDRLDFALTRSSNQFLFFLDKVIRSEVTGEQQKQVDGLFNVEVQSAKDFLSPVSAGIEQISMDHGLIHFILGKVVFPQYLQLKLKLVRKTWFLIKNKKVFEGVLDSSAYSLKDNGGLTEVVIDLSQLKKENELKKGNYIISLEVSLSPEKLSTAMNADLVQEKAKIKKEVTLKKVRF